MASGTLAPMISGKAAIGTKREQIGCRRLAWRATGDQHAARPTLGTGRVPGSAIAMDIRKITEELSVAPQISARDVSAIAAAGFRAVICNRPDGESSDQPCCEEIEAAVMACGLAWRSQPVRSDGVTLEDAEAFGALMAELPKPVLAFCRSGTRCAALWCLSQAGTRPLPDILARAQAAGYDMTAVMQRALGPGA
jgi:sulfide:quinone oxidoreductase